MKNMFKIWFMEFGKPHMDAINFEFSRFNCGEHNVKIDPNVSKKNKQR